MGNVFGKWLAAATVGGLVCLSCAYAGDATALKGRAGGPATQLIQVGAEPVAFTLKDLEKLDVSLEDYRGDKAVLLTFWSFFCGPCREEIPLLDTLGKKYAAEGFEILAINLDGPRLEKAVRKYMASNGFTFRVLWEELEGVSYVTADAYGVVGTPTLVLIGKDGKVSWTHVGRETPERIEAEVRKALSLGS
ncbi:MAG: hypothetical protein Kow0092_13590 [Deferrisomatales bacterium]